MKSEQHEWIKCNKLNALQSQEIIALKDRIKRLEEAGNEMAKWLDRNTPVTVRNDWLKAKEAKL